MRAEAEAAGKALGGRAGASVGEAGRRQVEAGLDGSLTPSVHLTRAHRIAHSAAGGRAPFAAARERIHEAAISLTQHVERELVGAADDSARFAIAARWAAAATHLDPRAAGLGPELPPAGELARQVVAIAQGPLALDDSVLAWELLKKARTVLYLVDGVGELPLDRLLLIEVGKRAKRLIAGVSGLPLAAKATADDLHRARLDDHVTEMVPIGPGEIGLVWEEASELLKSKLALADLVIAKGQSNFYALHEHEKDILKPFFCLFRTQCDPVAERLELTGRSTVMKVWK